MGRACACSREWEREKSAKTPKPRGCPGEDEAGEDGGRCDGVEQRGRPNIIDYPPKPEGHGSGTRQRYQDAEYYAAHAQRREPPLPYRKAQMQIGCD